MSSPSGKFKLVYYGDDFTGSTDALDFLARSGIRTRLFLEPPTKSELADLEGVQAIGIAGNTRSLPTEELRGLMQKVFNVLKEIDTAFFHYKICSTFDSSPETGSIGAVMEEAYDSFAPEVIPVIVGNPCIGRYTVFGNHFARMGTGDQGPVYRLDQHPSMRHHPVTPSRDGDLRDHLARQTHLNAGLIDVLQLEAPLSDCLSTVTAQAQKQQTEILFFDILKEAHFERIGNILHKLKPTQSPLFIVGSSAIEAALCALWEKNGDLRETLAQHSGSLPKGPVLIVSGSCSPVTAQQIKTGLQCGFAEEPLKPESMLSKDGILSIAHSTADKLSQGQSVIVHTCMGPEDARLTTSERSAGNGIGKALGTLIKAIMEKHPPAAICISGGDTSSDIARVLGLASMEYACAFVPGAPICKSPSIEGTLLNFKGGQVGTPSYFADFRECFQ